MRGGSSLIPTLGRLWASESGIAFAADIGRQLAGRAFRKSFAQVVEEGPIGEIAALELIRREADGSLPLIQRCTGTADGAPTPTATEPRSVSAAQLLRIRIIFSSVMSRIV